MIIASSWKIAMDCEKQQGTNVTPNIYFCTTGANNPIKIDTFNKLCVEVGRRNCSGMSIFLESSID